MPRARTAPTSLSNSTNPPTLTHPPYAFAYSRSRTRRRLCCTQSDGVGVILRGDHHAMDGKGRPTLLSRSKSVRVEKSDKYGVEWVDDKEVKSCTGCGKTTTRGFSLAC
jgi:hypothetical protein